MGTYYRVDNHDAREVIDLSPVANIKASAFGAHSLQQAILNVFLGFKAHFEWPEWTGRWELDRIRIHGDYEDDADCDEWPDAGMMFLAHLHKVGVLEQWLAYIGWSDEWSAMKGTEDLREWIARSTPESTEPPQAAINQS